MNEARPGRWVSSKTVCVIPPLCYGTINRNTDEGSQAMLPNTSGVIAIVALGALFVAALIWWLWWRLPQRQVSRLSLRIRDAKARADVEDQLRKTVGQALGGIVVLIRVFAYVQFVANQETTCQTFIIQEVANGFDDVGNDKLEIRMGGIYIL